MSRQTIIWMGLSVLVLHASVSHGEMQSSAMTVSTQTTHGAYTGSMERQGYASTLLSASFQGNPYFGIGLIARNARLYRQEGLNDIKQSDYGISLHTMKTLGMGGYLGLWGGVFSIRSDDEDSNKMLIPYAALSARVPGSSMYLDVGWAQSDYSSVRVLQLFATMGFEFFHPSLFARTRIYQIAMNTKVAGREKTLAVEHKLIWYGKPDQWTVTMAGLWGCRVHAFDPDIQVAYTLPDLQKGSGSLTFVHHFRPNLDIFADAAWEAYSKPSIGNDYSIFYGTFGLKYTF